MLFHEINELCMHKDNANLFNMTHPRNLLTLGLTIVFMINNRNGYTKYTKISFFLSKILLCTVFVKQIFAMQQPI